MSEKSEFGEQRQSAPAQRVPQGSEPARQVTRGPERIALDLILRFGLLAVFLYAAYRVVWPFLPLLAWSGILAVALYPIFAWLRQRLGGSGWLAATLVAIATLAIIFGPAAILCASLIDTLEALAGYVRTHGTALPAPPDALGQLPGGAALQAYWAQAATNSGEFLSHYAHTMIAPGEWLLGMIAGLAGSMMVFAVATVIAAILLPPGPRLAAGLTDIALNCSASAASFLSPSPDRPSGALPAASSEYRLCRRRSWGPSSSSTRSRMLVFSRWRG